MPYQINSSKLFLTYAQCALPKEDALQILIDKFQPVNYIVAHELHKNGDDHLHAYLELSQAYRSRDPKFADLEKDGRVWHGNYQGTRSSKNVIKYCTKAEDYLSNMDISNISKSTRSDDFRRLIDGSCTIPELISLKPQYLMDCQRLLNSLNCYKRLKGDARPNLPTFIPNPWGLVLPAYINGKCKNYWIHSDGPDWGKTYRFAKRLIAEYRGSLHSGECAYFNFTGNETFLILDEYNTAYLTYSSLNSMCDGTFAYRIFQGGNLHIKDPLIIVLSNRSIRDMYPNMYALLYARFKEIHLDSKCIKP